MSTLLELAFALFFNATWIWVGWMMITSFTEADETTEALFKSVNETTTNEKEKN